MNIQTSKVPYQGVARPGTYEWTKLQEAQETGKAPVKSGLEREPLDENLVEMPHLLVEASNLQAHSPSVGLMANVGVAGLAVVRAVQSFQVPGWTAKLEGVGAAAIAAASLAATAPGGIAIAIGQGASLTHGLIELGLGAYQTVDAVVEKDRGGGWKQIADGSLGVLKGLSTLAPMVVPSLQTPAHLVELGATFVRIGLKATDQ